MGFKPGQSGNPKGRRLGTKLQLTQEVRELARSLFDKAYWQRTREKMSAGTLHPMLEVKLLAYAFGEPPRDHEAQGRITINLGFLGSTEPPPHVTLTLDDAPASNLSDDEITATDGQVLGLPALISSCEPDEP